MKGTILVLETDEGDLDDLSTTFETVAGPGLRVESVRSAERLLERVGSGLPCDLVVLDYVLGDGRCNGEEMLQALRRKDPLVPIIAVAERGDVDSAEHAVRSGATDFLVRGGQLERRVSTLLGKVRGFIDVIERNRILNEQNELLRQADRAQYRIVGESPQIREVVRRVERVAAIPRPVLILGERGTGKELVARAIHDVGGDPNRPFVSVNCAALNDTLLETELFGHEKGAFSGAVQRVQGRFEHAAGGTLFLDEIGNMSLSFQRKILRVVEYGTFNRVGGQEEIRTDTRIIAATNADLDRGMEEGVFMRDLYDRLAFEVIRVPALRERVGDVDLLARHFLRRFIEEIPSLGGKSLAPSAIETLRTYPFPGNVRELKNIMERAAYQDAAADEISVKQLGLVQGVIEPPAASGRGFEEKVTLFKKKLILNALAESGGNQAEAARRLGLTYHRFRYHYRKWKNDSSG